MFTFFKPKNKHQISYTTYVSQEQRYQALLTKMQKEFEHNQQLIDCLQELKHLSLNQTDASQKHLFLSSLKLSPKRIEHYQNLSLEKIDTLLNDLINKQNKLTQDHHIFNHVKEELKINGLERRKISP
jgi:hypothetical protein